MANKFYDPNEGLTFLGCIAVFALTLEFLADPEKFQSFTSDDYKSHVQSFLGLEPKKDATDTTGL